ncbi:MAG TPA: Stk1 family PASTA domain-containing Ser/Thr kinase [Dermatophilaceae bacterium]|nr:Stk1 family PASTA domain-containing Ser/Thr kinase [Dermatophilaceae bacterium]
MSTPPRLLGGRYEVGELLGRGGMAEVHLGHDARLGRDVAIKMLRADLARDHSFLARFRREAQSAAGLNHPAIVSVYDSGEDQVIEAGGARASVPYIVMEFVRGRTLRDVLREAGRLPSQDAARYTEGILEALAYSHRNGIIHRDIKPANVMVTDTDEVKVMDFGIARAIADTSATMTQTQSVIGTAQYLSPEQAQGQPVDARSDLYSTGCLLYELLTGRTPFLGDSPVAVAYQHVQQVAPPPSELAPGISANLDAVVMHALVKDRDGRYQSAEQFRDDLYAARSGHPISTAARGTAAGLVGAAGFNGPATQVVDTLAGGRLLDDRTGNTATLPAIGRDPADIPRKRHGATYVLLTLAVIAALVLVVLAGRALLGENKDTPTITVPNVLNMTQAQATARLTQDGFTPQASAVPSEQKKGLVIDQNPQAGEKLPADSVVTISVSSGPDSVQVPDVTGFTEDSARAQLAAVGLQVGDVKQVDVDQTPTITKGKVVETEPKAGESVAADSRVALRVSTGKVTVPNLLGQPQSQAQSALVDRGLRFSVTYQPSSQPEGTVIKQDSVNKKVDLGTQVKLVIAQAPAPTPTPPPPTETTTTSTPTVTTTTTAP